MSAFDQLAPVTIACAFVVGMVLALLGSVKLPLAKRLDLTEARIGCRRAVGLVAMLSVGAALLASLPLRDLFPQPAQGGNLAAVLGSPILWLTGLAVFLYMPLESALGAWATTYLGELRVRENR